MVQFNVPIETIGGVFPDGQTKNGSDQRKTPEDVYTLDEAITETKMGKCQWILILLTGLCVLGSSTENTNISFIMPYVKCDLEVTSGEQGVLSSISYLGVVFTSHFWGFMADTWGRQKVLRLAAAMGFVFSFASAFAMNTISMIILRFIAGASVAGITSAGYSYVSEFHTSATAARSAAFVTIALLTPWVLMSPLAMLVIPMDWNLSIFSLDYKPWRFFITCTSTIHLANAIVLSFLPESPKFLLAMGKKEEALDVLSRMFALNTGEPKEKYPVKKLEIITTGNNLSDVKGVIGFLSMIVNQTKPIFLPPLVTNTWKMSYIIFVMFAIGHGAYVWFPEFLTQLQNYEGLPKTLCEIVGPKADIDVCNIDNHNISSFEMLLAVGLVFMILSIASSFYLKMIDPKKLVCAWLLLSTIACFSLNFFTNFYIIVGAFIFFLTCNVISNIVMAVAVNLFPTNYRGVATSFIIVCGRIGSVGGSSIVGVLLNDNCTVIFYVYGSVLISCAFVFMMIKIKSR